MSKVNKICGVVDSRVDPYSHRAAKVESREFWRWGSDNRLPFLLSEISRCSTTHRRDYLSILFVHACNVALSCKT